MDHLEVESNTSVRDSAQVQNRRVGNDFVEHSC